MSWICWVTGGAVIVQIVLNNDTCAGKPHLSGLHSSHGPIEIAKRARRAGSQAHRGGSARARASPSVAHDGALRRATAHGEAGGRAPRPTAHAPVPSRSGARARRAPRP